MKRRCIVELIILSFTIFVFQSKCDENGFCRFQEFRCQGGTVCLLSEKLCDGNEDCPSGEDEVGNDQWDCSRVTLGTPGECGDQQKFFKCRFGGCISRSQLCDGRPHCWGGTDEASDLCGMRRKIVDSLVAISTTTARYITPTFSTKRPTPTPRPVITSSQRTIPPRRKIPSESPSHIPPPSYTTEFHEASTTTSSIHISGSTAIGMKVCPPIQLKEGEEVNCFHSEVAQIIDCRRKPSPEKTKAVIKCAKFWSPPRTGSRSRERICSNGNWIGGSRNFRCELDCGEGGFAPVALVAGGITSTKGKWPWHSGLYEADPPGSNKYSNICGATLIASNAVITAAHCVTIRHTNDAKNRRDLLVFMGKFHRTVSNNDENVQPIKPSKIILHPDYNYANLDSDIAIILLEKNVVITPFVHPVCLPSDEYELHTGFKGSLAGWGSIGDREYPEELQEAELPYVSSHICKQSHSALKLLIGQTNFCAGYRNGTSACDGDSGGGLVFTHPEESSKWVIGGVVSGGVPRGAGLGCDPQHFVAFSNVAKFRRWIDQVLDRGNDEFK